MKKEDQIADELSHLLSHLETNPRINYYPEVNKGLLVQLKNYLLDASIKIRQLALSVLCSLLKRTPRHLHDGVALFYPELIDKLRSKSK